MHGKTDTGNAVRGVPTLYKQSRDHQYRRQRRAFTRRCARSDGTKQQWESRNALFNPEIPHGIGCRRGHARRRLRFGAGRQDRCHPRLHGADRVADARNGRQRGTRAEGDQRQRHVPERREAGVGPGGLDLYRCGRGHRRRGAPGDLGERGWHHGRRLLRRHHRYRQQCRGAQRRRHGLAVGDLAGADRYRGQWLLLPYRAVRCAPGRGAVPDPRRQGYQEGRSNLHEQ